MSKLGIAFIVIISIVAMCGISFYVVTNVVNPSNQSIKTIMIPVGNPKEPSLVNIMGSRACLQYSISLEVNEKLYQKSEGKSMSRMDAIIQDALVEVLRTQKFEDLQSHKQEMLKEKIKTRINEALNVELVVKVYILNFVVGY